jgi:hypothetical protein
MPVTLCKAMYFSAVMKVPPSRGSCTSRSHPHFSHASGIHWRGSELVVMSASSQPATAYPFGRIGQLSGAGCASRWGRIFILLAADPYAALRISAETWLRTHRICSTHLLGVLTTRAARRLLRIRSLVR